MSNRGVLKTYYALTKPGIIYGNALTAIGGFLLASKGHINIWLLIATLAGISLVIASACVFNNYIDRGIDTKMARTKKRALALGAISGRNALIYATILGIVGFLLLALYTNWAVVLLGVIALINYVILYGISKRHAPYGTIVGSISGAMPVVAGYVAVTNQLDMGALILFLVLVFWQMPHFYAIAMYRRDDYAAAGIPVLPVKKGAQATKVRILLYIAAFIAATCSLTIFGYAGYTYLVIMVGLGLAWLWRGLQGFKTADEKRWARRMFLFSLLVITAFSFMLSVNAWLP